ncbi:MAG: radical SAM/SPASM domain-containing protein [Candidatus Ozemobacteraceae bacterium]
MIDLDRFKRLLWLRAWYLKIKLPMRFPMILNIEPTNRCNLACEMCPRAKSGRPLVDLDWTVFERLCGELRREGPIQRVFLQKDGEPLLYKRLPEMIALLRTNHAAKNISVISNGTLLTTALFDRLAASGLDDLIISIDAVDSAGYRALKGADLYETVVANVEAALAIKRARGLRFPLIKARMVERKGAEADVELFRRRWTGVADAVDVTPFHTWMGSVEDHRTYVTKSRYPCSLLWYTGIINADATVSPCCIDYSCRGVLGKLGEGGFSPLWNGRELGVLRRRHLRGEYDQTAICGSCEYWQIKEDLGAWLRRKYRCGNAVE